MAAHEIGGGFGGGFQRRVHGCLAEWHRVMPAKAGIQYAGNRDGRSRGVLVARSRA